MPEPRLMHSVPLFTWCYGKPANMRLLGTWFVLALLIIAVHCQASIDEWEERGSLDLVTYKLGLVTPIGRLGLIPAASVQTIGGPSTLAFADLEQLTPARILNFYDIDIPESETVTYVVAPKPTIDTVYLVLQSGSSSIVRPYNVSSYVRTEVQTIKNITEIDYGDGNITVIEHGEYNVTVEELVPSIQRIGSFQATALPILHSGVWDNENNVGYFVSIASTPTLCKLNASLGLLGCIDLPNLGAVVKLHVDSSAQMVYVVTKTKLARVNGSSEDFGMASFEETTLPVPNVLCAVFETSVTKKLYLSVETGAILRFDLNVWSMETDYNLTIPRFTAARAGDIDTEYGFIYFASFSNPAIIAKINALTGELSGTFTVFGSLSRATQLSVDNNGRDIYVTDYANFVKVSAPAPCPRFCSGKGTCKFGGECECIEGWQDIDCASLVCPLAPVHNHSTSTSTEMQQCAGVGACRNGTCECYPGYNGTDCTVFLCPSGCSNRGTCDVDSHTCTCDRGYGGEGCEFLLAYLPCDQAVSCSECSLNPNCVWCESTSTCLAGNIQGPAEVHCPDFFYQYCPDVAYYVVPAILIVIWCLMFIINVVSAAMEDFGGEPSPAEKAQAARAAWWRTVRSANTWSVLETFQYIGLLATLGSSGIPTYFVQYSRVFFWSLVGVRPIWDTPYIFDAQSVSAKRSLLSWIQTAHSYGTSPALIVIGVISILVIFLIAMAIVFAVLHFLKRENLIDRWFYVLFRLLLFFQIPVVASGSAAITYAIQYSDDWAGLVFGFIGVLGYLAATIYAIIYFVRLNPKLIFLATYRRRLAALIAPYHYLKPWFIGAYLLKKIIIGCAFGFLASSSTPEAALGIAIGVTVVYVILLGILRVYLENTCMIADIVVSLLQVAMFGICFGILYNPTPVITIAVVCAHAASVLVSLVTYFIHWMRYRNVFTLKQFCSCKKG